MGLGFLFPGQGAQRVGMLADVAGAHPGVRERFAEASEALGFDLAAIVRDGPAEELNKTEVTQPALLTASFALFELWTEHGGPTPPVAAGHSLGEYSALAVAGVLDFPTAVRLVHERGKLMQEAVPFGEGAMAAIIGLDDEQVEQCCAEAGGQVTPANYNAPGQVVIAGAAAAVAAAGERCSAAGARRVVPLDVSVPSHCALMAPAGERLAELLTAASFLDARLPVVQNVNAVATTDASAIRANLLRQLVSPVRWADSLRAMAGDGATEFVECGPGNVLAGLARRIDRALAVDGIGDLGGLEAALNKRTGTTTQAAGGAGG